MRYGHQGPYLWHDFRFLWNYVTLLTVLKWCVVSGLFTYTLFTYGLARWDRITVDSISVNISFSFFFYQMGHNSAAVLASLMSHATEAPVISHTSYECKCCCFSADFYVLIMTLKRTNAVSFSHAGFWPWEKQTHKRLMTFLQTSFEYLPPIC